MTSIPQPAAVVGRGRPSTLLRRALALEWRLHRERLVLLAGLSAVTVLLAALMDIRLGVVAILLAARLPADLADRVPEDGRQLRGALGISRAQGVRARTLMICAGQLVLALGAAGAILLGDWPASARHWSSFDIRPASEGLRPMGWRDHLMDIGLWIGALLWTHALTGGRAFDLGVRPSAVVALARFLGCCLLAGAGIAVACWLLGAVLPAVTAARLAQVLVLVLTLGGGALALVLGQRRWRHRA